MAAQEMAQDPQRDPYKYFRPEAREILDQFSRGVLDLEKGEGGAATVQRLLRLAHTLKGAARVVKQPDIANRAHAIEELLAPLRGSAASVGRSQVDAVLRELDAINGRLSALAPVAEPPAAANGKPAVEEAVRTLRTDIAEADAVRDGVVETHALLNALRTAARGVQDSAQLANIQTAHHAAAFSAADGDCGRTRPNRRANLADELRSKLDTAGRDLESAIDQMDRELRQLRETAERLRLVALDGLFTALERIARDTARAQAKEVAFAADGGDIRLDAQVLDTIQGALIQIVRNAVAHGIETADERKNGGKSPIGTVSVGVFRRDRRIVFSCSDDGKGIDLDAVRRAASQRGLMASAAAAPAPEELMRLLLRGGISTFKTVTEEAGRGIGLDVVRESVERLGGQLECRSEGGAGTTFEIVIPPSLSSMDALLLDVGGRSGIVAIPLDAVRRTRRLATNELTFADAGASVIHDGAAIPFVPLAAVLDGTPWSPGGNWASVVLAGAGGLAALGVGRLLGTARIVVRPLPQHMVAGPAVLGAALDVDGNPQLILDPEGLIGAARRGATGEPQALPQRRPVLVVDDSLTTRMLEQSILESAGYDVDLAVSGEEALERVRHKAYALILVDVEMPGMDGFTFIERIRADSRTRDIPAILVTSLAKPEHRQRGRDAGAQGYIVKSEFDQAALLSMIQPMMAA